MFIIRFILLTLLFTLTTSNVNATANKSNFLILTDVHFDPFASCVEKTACPLIDALEKASPEQWRDLLAQNPHLPIKPNKDTTNALWLSTLGEIKNLIATQQPDFILWQGDTLDHLMHEKFDQFSSIKTDTAYAIFIKKTYLYLANSLKNVIPKNVPVYFVMGNVDGFSPRYSTDLKSQFFPYIANLWRNTFNLSKAFETQFSHAGYYHLALNKNIDLIVLNSVIFSMKGTLIQKENEHETLRSVAKQELHWLNNQLKNDARLHCKALLVMHLPPDHGLFSYLWDTTIQKEFMTIIEHSLVVNPTLLAAHLHISTSFQLDDKYQVSIAPSISPILANNPAIERLYYRSENGQLTGKEIYSFTNNSWMLKKDFDFSAMRSEMVKHLENLRTLKSPSH